jgi:hypothetical protein
MSLIRQHIIISSVFKLGALSLAGTLAGYRVRKFLNTEKITEYRGEMEY